MDKNNLKNCKDEAMQIASEKKPVIDPTKKTT